MNTDNFLHTAINTYRSQPTRHAIKTAMAAIITAIICHFLNFPRSYWAVITAVFIMQCNIDSGSFEMTVKFAFQRLLGTLSGAIIAFAVLLLISPTFWQLLIILFFVILLGSFLVKFYQGFTLLGPTAAIILLLGHQQAVTENLALMRSIEIFIGAIVAILITLFIWPYRAIDHLENYRKKIWSLTADQFNNLIPACREQEISGDWRKKQEELMDLVKSEKPYINTFRKESKTKQQHTFYIDIRLMKLLSRLGEALPQLPQSYWQFPQLQKHTLSVITLLKQATENLSEKNPKANVFDQKIMNEYTMVFEDYRLARRQTVTTSDEIEGVYRIFMVFQALQECVEIVETIYQQRVRYRQ
ncbi:MAG: FUSC family protein [Pseudomonadota bacterium]